MAKIALARGGHRRHGEQVRIHRDVPLELAQSGNTDFHQALERICCRAAATLGVARVSYCSLEDRDSIVARPGQDQR
jgi:hypothetical protein